MSFTRRAILNRQEGVLTIPNTGPGAGPVHVDLTVLNSSFVSLRNLGTDVQGTDSEAETYVALTLSILSATSVRIIANRGVYVVGDVQTVTRYELDDLNPVFVKSIQRSQGSQVVTAVDILRCNLSNLGVTYTGSVTGRQSGYVKLTDSTHVDQVDNSGNTGTSVSWELVESY